MSAYGLGGGRGGAGPRFPPGPKRYEGGPPGEFPRGGGGERFDCNAVPLGMPRPHSQPWYQPPPPPPLPSFPPPPRPPGPAPPGPAPVGHWDRGMRGNYGAPGPPSRAAADFWKTMSTVKESQNPPLPDMPTGKGGEFRSGDIGMHKKLAEKSRIGNGKRRDASDYMHSPGPSKQIFAMNGEMPSQITREKPGVPFIRHSTEESFNKQPFLKNSDEKKPKPENSLHKQNFGKPSSFSSSQIPAHGVGNGSAPSASRIRTSVHASKDSLLPPPISPKSTLTGAGVSPYSPSFPNGPVSPLANTSGPKSIMPPISPVSGPSPVLSKRSSTSSTTESEMSREKKRRRWGQGLRTPLRTPNSQTPSPKMSGEERTEKVAEVKIERGLQPQENHVEKESNKEMQARTSLDCNGTAGISASKSDMNTPDKGAQTTKPTDGIVLSSASKEEGIPSTSGSIEPRIESVSPNSEGLLLKPESSVPKLEDATPRPEGKAPKTESAAPKSEGLAPKPENAALKLESAAPKSEVPMLVSEESAPESESATPKPEVSELEVSELKVSAPKIESSAPKLEGSTLKPEETPHPSTSMNEQTSKAGKATDGSTSHAIKGAELDASLDVEMDAVVTPGPPPHISERDLGQQAKSTSENDSSAERLKATANVPLTPAIPDTNDASNKPTEQLINQTSEHRESNEKLEDSDTEMTAPAEVNTQHDNETAPYDLQTIEKDREEVGNAKQQQRILITQILDLDAEITKLEAEANEIEEENASKKEVLASYEMSISKINREFINPSSKDEEFTNGTASEDELECGNEDAPTQHLNSEQLFRQIMLRNKKKANQANKESNLMSNEDEMLTPSSEVSEDASDKRSWNQLYVTTAGALELAIKLDRWQGLESHEKSRELFTAILGARRAAIARRNEELAEIHCKNWVEHRKRMIQAENAPLKAKAESNRTPASNNASANDGGNTGAFPGLSDRELRLIERNGRGKDSSFYQMGFVRSEYEEQQILLRLQHDEQLKTLVKQPGNVIDQSSLGMRWAANKNGWRPNPEADQELRYRRKPWTPDEVERFVELFSLLGKDFRKISKKLSTRSTQECVEFFYIHQKTSNFRILKGKYERKGRSASSAASIHSVSNVADKTRSSSEISRNSKAQAGSISGGRGGILASKITSEPKQSAGEEEDQLVAIIQCRKRKRSTRRSKPSSESLARLRGLLEPFWTLEDEKKFFAAVKSHGKNFKAIATAVGGFKNASDCRQFYAKNRKRVDLHLSDEKYSSSGTRDLNGRTSASVEHLVKKEDDGSVMKAGVLSPDDNGNSSRIASSSLREKMAFQEKQSAMSTSAIPLNEGNPIDQYSSIPKSAVNDGNRNFAGMNDIPQNEGKASVHEENGTARLPNQYLGLPMSIHQLQGWPDASLIMPPMPNSRAQPHRPIPDLRNIRSNMTSNEMASNNSRQGHGANNFDAANEMMLQNSNAALGAIKGTNTMNLLPFIYQAGGNLYGHQSHDRSQVQNGVNGNDVRGSVSSSTPTSNIYEALHSAAQANQRVEIPNLSVLNASQIHPFALQAQLQQHQRNAAQLQQQAHGVSHTSAETSQIENLHKGARGPIGVDSALNTSERVAQMYGRNPAAQQLQYNPQLAPFVSQMIGAQPQHNLAAASAARLYHNSLQPHAAFQFPDQANSNAYAASIMSLIPNGFVFAPGAIYDQLQPQNSSPAMPKQPEQRKDDQRKE